LADFANAMKKVFEGSAKNDGLTALQVSDSSYGKLC